jgi:hypothetical protein
MARDNVRKVPNNQTSLHVKADSGQFSYLRIVFSPTHPKMGEPGKMRSPPEG